MSEHIEEQYYYERASTALRQLVEALDKVSQANDDAFEVEFASDIITLDFPDNSRFVINSHRAARQIWMAANTSAWHFNWHEDVGQWLCSKTNAELWTVVEDQLGRKTGKRVALRQ
jgi:CyaY protein